MVQWTHHCALCDFRCTDQHLHRDTVLETGQCHRPASDPGTAQYGVCRLVLSLCRWRLFRPRLLRPDLVPGHQGRQRHFFRDPQLAHDLGFGHHVCGLWDTNLHDRILHAFHDCFIGPDGYWRRSPLDLAGGHRSCQVDRLSGLLWLRHRTGDATTPDRGTNSAPYRRCPRRHFGHDVYQPIRWRSVHFCGPKHFHQPSAQWIGKSCTKPQSRYCSCDWCHESEGRH